MSPKSLCIIDIDLYASARFVCLTTVRNVVICIRPTVKCVYFSVGELYVHSDVVHGAVCLLSAMQGLDCAFSHNGTRLKKPRLCRYYKSGHCNNKSRDCSYHHETWPCVQFHRDGSCTDGDQCRYSHQELCDETRPLLEKVCLTSSFVLHCQPAKQCRKIRGMVGGVA